MATAQVTLKVTPNELQVIDEALRLLVEASSAIARDEKMPKTCEVDVSVAEFDPRKLAVRAGEIRRNIGLKR